MFEVGVADGAAVVLYAGTGEISNGTRDAESGVHSR